jgi:AAA+ superfamily predicted ATPase
MDNNLNQNLLNQVGEISHAATKCNLDFNKMNQVKDAVLEIADFLTITFEQAILFSCLVELSLQKTVTLETLARHFRCSILKIIVIIHEIDALEKQSLVKKKLRSVRAKKSYNNIGYSVPHNIIESLRTSDKSYLNPDPKMNFPNLLEQVKVTVKEREDELISTHHLKDEIEFLLQNNREYAFVQYINKNLAKTTNKCVVLALAYYHLTGLILMDIDSIPEAVFDDINDQIEFKRSIASGNSELIRTGVITLQQSDFANERVISLSQQSISILYQEYPELKMQEASNIGLIKFDSIIDKPLFFNNELSIQINNIQSVLKKQKFSSFQKTAQKNKLNKGITVVFYGYPGTGKTEAVYQIAKKTGRNIMMVDLSETKSMWFGQSEKQVKKIFDDYRLVTKNYRITPILFINEVDGLFSKRQGIGNNATSTLQVLNTMQNILLQEMEVFDGILFATTNLMQNLDKAFDRRFLFKLKFTHPDAASRHKIWKNRLPELSHKQATLLSDKYELTGGGIENMIRQTLLAQMVDNKLDIFDSLNNNCIQESGYNSNNRIGF